jgi:hypothetical protein
LVWRRGETNSAVLAVIEALTGDVGDLPVDDESNWLPAGDPHRAGTG